MSESTSNLFAMFRRYKEYDVEDPETGEKAKIAIRSLVTFEQDKLGRELDKARRTARKEIDTPDTRESAAVIIQGMSRAAKIYRALSFERPFALINADLAPDIEDPKSEQTEPAPTDVVGDVVTGEVVAVEVAPPVDESASKTTAPGEEPAASPTAVDQDGGLTARDRKTLVRWERERRDELDKMSDDDLAQVIVDRTVNMTVQGRAMSLYTDHELVMIVVSPSETPSQRRPLLSMDENTDNYIGLLSAGAKNELMKCRADFINGTGEKKTREAATDPAFLSNGASPSEPAGSRGAMAATPSTFPGQLYGSTISEDGSTESMKP